MNPKDRFISAMELEEPDSVPFAPLISGQYIPKACQVTYTRFIYGDNHFRAACYVKANEMFESDWIYTGIGRTLEDLERYKVSSSDGYAYVYDAVEDKMSVMPVDEYPYTYGAGMAAYPYGKDRGLERCLEELEVKRGVYSDLQNSVTFDESSLEQIEEIVRLVAGRKFVAYVMGGPAYETFSLAGLNYLLAYYQEPERLKKTLGIVTENSKQLIERIANTQTDAVIIGEGMCSGDVISKQFYKEFAQPFHKQLVEHIRTLGLYSILWFWGDPMDRLGEIAEVKPDCLWVEETMRNYVIDLSKIKEMLGRKMCTMGNMDGRKLAGHEAEVAEDATRCIREGSPGGGYVFSTGRPISEEVPISNVSYLGKTLRDIGRYPISGESL